ncbi:alpha/beta fold hydrolase [Nakamurella sp. GG22]
MTITSTTTRAAVPPRLFVHRVGSGDPLVLLHGMGESHVGWRPVIDALAADRDVIAIDLPGFGESPALSPQVPPTAANLAAAVQATLDREGVDRYDVAGYSLGARVALDLARSPRVRSVIAIGPDGLGTPLERVGGYFGLLAGRGVAMALAPAADQLSRTPVGRMFFFSGNRSLPWQLPPTDARELLTGFAAAPAYDAVNWVGMFDVATHLHTIDQPVLFLQGTADPITSQVLRYLPLIAHAELKLMPGLNHVPISDDPAGVVSNMKEFLQRVTD